MISFKLFMMLKGKICPLRYKKHVTVDKEIIINILKYSSDLDLISNAGRNRKLKLSHMIKVYDHYTISINIPTFCHWT